MSSAPADVLVLVLVEASATVALAFSCRDCSVMAVAVFVFVRGCSRQGHQSCSMTAGPALQHLAGCIHAHAQQRSTPCMHRQTSPLMGRAGLCTSARIRCLNQPCHRGTAAAYLHTVARYGL